MRYEIFAMTNAGAILGTFDDPDEANNTFKWLRSQKDWPVVARTVNDDIVVKEKRFISNTIAAGYRGGLEPSVSGLTDALSNVTDELEKTKPNYGRYSLRKLYFAYPHEKQPIVHAWLTERQVEQIMSNSITEPGYGTEWVWMPTSND